MTWFSASIFFKSEHSIESNEEPLWEECVYLIQAETHDEAMKNAISIGRKNEVEYAVSDNDNVSWKFVKVERLIQIDTNELKNGTEVFSRFLRDKEVESLFTPFDD